MEAHTRTGAREFHFLVVRVTVSFDIRNPRIAPTLAHPRRGGWLWRPWNRSRVMVSRRITGARFAVVAVAFESHRGGGV
jgi:hypothetical protein